LGTSRPACANHTGENNTNLALMRWTAPAPGIEVP